MTANPCNVLLISPVFHGLSFWNYQEVCEMAGSRYPLPPLGLITVAAMLPENWNLRLVDRNTRELTDADIDWADLVMTGGMMIQQPDMLALVERCHERGKPIAVGGPDITSSPHLYAAADFKVLGEAEDVIDDFIAAWEGGARSGTFEAPKYQANITHTPVPRFDLLHLQDYLMIGVQYSRGCPFTCEFCDIIELYGRVPRTKTDAQMLAELGALYALGFRGLVNFVDDNLIGNKKAVKRFLPQLIEWQRARGYPFDFNTEASLNMADDPELLRLMRDANFTAVFMGLESPDSDVLVAASKKQNTRGNMAERVHEILRAGILPTAGFVVGFDEEKPDNAEQLVELIEEAAIPVSAVSLLCALPQTQLTRRLRREGRLLNEQEVESMEGDFCIGGLNFQTKRDRVELLSGFREIYRRLYEPEAYFARVRRLGELLDVSGRPRQARLSEALSMLKLLVPFLARITAQRPEMRGPFWKALIRAFLRHPGAFIPIAKTMAMYVHLGPFAEHVVRETDRQIERLLQAREQQAEATPAA